MIREQLKEAKKACRFMQNVKPEVKNKALNFQKSIYINSPTNYKYS